MNSSTRNTLLRSGLFGILLVWACAFSGIPHAEEISETAPAGNLAQPMRRQGFYISLGIGGSLGSIEDNDIGSLGTFSSFDIGLRTGQMVTNMLGLGIQINGQRGQSKDWSNISGGIRLEAQLLPFAHASWKSLDALAIRTGIGIAAGELKRHDKSLESKDDPAGIFGTQYMLGLSYDWFPAKITPKPSGGLALTLFSEGRFLPTEGTTMVSFVAGIEITWWLGLARNQLDLPIKDAFRQ